MTPDKTRAARQMYDQKGMTVAQIAQVLGVGRTTVYRALDRDVHPGGPTQRRRQPR